MSALGKCYHFRPLETDDEESSARSPEPVGGAVPDQWRSLDLAVARWVRIHDGSQLLASVAGWASLAEGHGDSALPLVGSESARHDMPALGAEAVATLGEQPMVEVIKDGETSQVITPFVVQHGHLYLRRNFAHEVAVASALQKRRMSSMNPNPAPAGDINALFGTDATNPNSQAQRDAVSRVLGRRLFVLTGGPGTGKTTTVLRMLLMLLKDRSEQNLPEPIIRISAPTGKAAQRLSESLRTGATRLIDDKLDEQWSKHLDVALAADASTLHRLLGSRGPSGGFRFNARNPLPADIVVVDEASMVDLAMLRALLDATRDDAAVIFVGDADQLTSVGTGSVLMDLVTVLERQKAPELVRLTHSFRAEAELQRINESILAGKLAGFVAALAAAGDKAKHNKSVETTADLSLILSKWGRALDRVLDEGQAYEPVPVGKGERIFDALDALKKRQLLCALRTGEFGSTEANEALEKTLRKQRGENTNAEWYAGRAVMITRNDAAAGLFNGDVGICLREKNGPLRVWFEVTATVNDGTSEGTPTDVYFEGRRARALAPGSLPEHQGAFAVTIHKSQGSEYNHVSLLFPPDASNRILSCQLLYTGASRAKQVVELWATDAVLRATIGNRVERAGGLRERLA